MLQNHAHGVVLLLRVQPGARRQGIVGTHADRLKVAVHAAPEKGKANKAVIEVLCDELNLKRSQLQLIAGETSSDKQVLISNESIEELQTRIAVMLGDTNLQR